MQSRHPATIQSPSRWPDCGRMRKIPTIFIRDTVTMLRYVKDEPHPDCGWVFGGEGVATRKFDGTCVMIRDGEMFKRREVKKGALVPVGFEQVEADPVTGKIVGWVEVGNGSEDKWHRAAFEQDVADGTYELCGPKVQGNPEGFRGHVLVRHGRETLNDVPRDFNGLSGWLHDHQYEGIVFHHADGRMAKIKNRDFAEA